MGRQVPPPRGTGLAVRQTNGSAFRPATFGAPLPSDGDAKGSKPTIWHDSPPGCAARQRSHAARHMHGGMTMQRFDETNPRTRFGETNPRSAHRLDAQGLGG